VIAANRAKAARFNDLLRPLAAHPRVRDFRHCGMIWAFEVDAAPQDFARRFFHAALEAELLLRPIGDTVYFMPPYVIAEEEMNLLAERTRALLDRL
jgi:adenosylmethionine-8-amino-7-oxononanoate aminotransferase